MAQAKKSEEICSSKQEIIEYCDIPEKSYSEFVRLGLPVVYVNNRPYAVKSNLDAFFKVFTRKGDGRAPEAEQE